MLFPNSEDCIEQVQIKDLSEILREKKDSFHVLE